MKYLYYVNMDERGSFYADVRDNYERTIFEVRAGNELAENETSLVDDGFMVNVYDVAGLTVYLSGLGILTNHDWIVEEGR